MLRNDFATFEANMAAGQLGAYAVPINWHFTPEEAGYILADCRAKVLVIHADLLAQVAAGIPVGIEGAGRADAAGDRRRLWRAGGEARSAPRASRPGTPSLPRSAPNTAAAQGLARQHDLHLGHDRPAQGRAAPALDARAAGQGAPAEIGKHWGLVADPSIVVMMNGPMYHSAPAAYGMQQRAARAARSCCSRASRPRTCCG